MQSAQHNLAPAAPIPPRQLERSVGKRQMHGDPNYLGNGGKRRPPDEQIFVPILHFPVLRRGCGKAGQSECWSKHVLAKTRIGIFGIERINEQRRLFLDRPRFGRRVEIRRLRHVRRTPAAPGRLEERPIG